MNFPYASIEARGTTLVAMATSGHVLDDSYCRGGGNKGLYMTRMLVEDSVSILAKHFMFAGSLERTQGVKPSGLALATRVLSSGQRPCYFSLKWSWSPKLIS
ncbi:hypothetical protein VNO77_04103 [Canavalia gladiata]|uniref:Uncharacterized protein n=1 Tax=Canavalia gladiata TaxID=3824 RepID=A0AAN9MY03_CANGL